MATICIPRSAVSRGMPTYALLLRRVHPDRIGARTFEGKYLKCGLRVEQSQLRPDPSYPENPVLLEFAGSDCAGRGHNRSGQIHVLWRLEDHYWVEVAKSIGKGADWVEQLRPLALREVGGPPAADQKLAFQTATGLVSRLDEDFRNLSNVDRQIALSLVYEQIAARMVDSEPATGHILSL